MDSSADTRMCFTDYLECDNVVYLNRWPTLSPEEIARPAHRSRFDITAISSGHQITKLSYPTAVPDSLLSVRHNGHYRLRDSASTVFTATGFTNGRGQFLTPHKIHTPWPIIKKFVASDYVCDPYGCAKFCVARLVQIRPRESSGQISEM